MPERPYAPGDRVRITIDGTVTSYDEAEGTLTVHYSSTLGTAESTVATDSTYARIENILAFEPQLGDLWQDTDGDVWFATEEAGGDLVMVLDADSKPRHPDELRSFGPMTRLYRKGATS